MVGYAPLAFTPSDIPAREIILESKESVLEQVTVVKSRLHTVQMGEEFVTASEAKNLPAILGEVDIIKVMQLKPGVKNGGEGMAGFYVRGGGADQNLVRLDGFPIYNANHLLGLFSIFNNDAISDAKLYKSGYSPLYGGRLSSVLDVTSRKASLDSFNAGGGVGLLSSRAFIESPIKKGKSSILISARRTYVDLLTNFINSRHKSEADYKPIPGYFFSEFNLRSDFKINKNNSLWATAYAGTDNFNSHDKSYPAKFKWGNTGASVNWKSIINPGTNIVTTGFYSGYNYSLSNGFEFDGAEVQSGIKTTGLNIVASNIKNAFRTQAGVTIMRHAMTIGNYSYTTALSNNQSGERIGGTEWAAFAGTEWDDNRKLSVAAGIRLSGFVAKDKSYVNPEPRISAKYDINENSALKWSYTRMYQYLHLASLSSVSLPVDIWYPTTQKTKPEYADQLSIGYSRSISRAFFFNTEGYYKWMNNQVEFADGASLIGNPKIEDQFVFGKANAYGLEACLEKKTGKTKGWVGYTLSWVSRTFADINDGRPFRPRYDRRHDVSVVVTHKINNTFTLSFSWVYGTGAYTTLPVGRYVFQNESGVTPRSIVPVYKDRNNYQLPPVHRLDLGLVANLKSKKGRQQDITFSLYNVYNRRNPFYIEYEERGEKPGYVTSILPKIVSLFPVLPGITYNFKF